MATWENSDEGREYAAWSASNPTTNSWNNWLAYKAKQTNSANAKAQAVQDRADRTDFIQSMQNPDEAALANSISSERTQYKNVLDKYLAEATPTLSTSNRFGNGLNYSEKRLQSLLDSPASIQESAAYKFRVGQGSEALQRAMGAKGLLNSGNRLTELTKYGQDMASQEYDNQYNRLKGLYDTNSQGWIADKNANTAQFGAESSAHTGRGNMLSNLYGTTTNASIASQNNITGNNIKAASVYEQGRSNNMDNALNKAKLNIGGVNPGWADSSYAYGGY